ncbi:lipase family protein [Streptomyces sp. YKOK-I1]
MQRSVVFVHGTGVREKSYDRTYATVHAELAGLRPGVGVRGCFWGREAGAGLALDGASIPGYSESRGGRRAEDEDIAVWGVLYRDPGYELRLLGLRPAAVSGMDRGRSSGQKLLDELSGYAPSAQVRDAFAAHGLSDALDRALRRVTESPELRDAAVTADEDGHEHRHAFARAVVAAALADAVDAGADAPDGLRRDALLTLIGADLHSQGRTLAGTVAKAAAAPALLALTWHARRHRGAHSDGALVPAVGDILRYQARGLALRRLIKRTIEHAPGDAVTVIAHSLGGVACVDLMVEERIDRVDQLITVGSQAPFFYEIGALVSLEHPRQPPAHFPRRWLNLYDPRDLLSFRAAQVFPAVATDHEVDNRQPFPFAHSAYWGNREVWDAIGTWLG